VTIALYKFTFTITITTTTGRKWSIRQRYTERKKSSRDLLQLEPVALLVKETWDGLETWKIKMMQIDLVTLYNNESRQN